METNSVGGLADRLTRLQARIAAAARRAGRSPDEVTLVAVTKNHPASLLQEALAAGISQVGENYVQEAMTKQAEVPNASFVWHFLGHLQTNKAKLAVQNFDMIQSVDSVRLAGVLAREAEHIGKTQDVLLQVHLGDEVSKFGLRPDEVGAGVSAMTALPGISLRGLMGIAPQGEDPRPYFRQLRRLYDALPAPQRHTLSMGMTGDFETAIEEGATMVRIGTALFGTRTG